jgi:hypothetical protein
MTAREPWSASESQRSGDVDPARPRADPAVTPLDERCAALVKALRERCPGVLPEEPLAPGAPGQPVPVDSQAYAELARLAARQAAAVAALGRAPSSDEELPDVALWEEGTAALAVSVAGVSVGLDEGSITVALPVWCDQLPRDRAVVQVTFAVGSPDRPAGLIAATSAEPDGPRPVLDDWGEQLTAFAWQVVLDSAERIAAQAGTDADGTPLVATAMAAARDRLEVLPQARHPFDRILTGRAVTP